MIISAIDLRPGDCLAFQRVDFDRLFEIEPVRVRPAEQREESAWYLWGQVMETGQAQIDAPYSDRFRRRVITVTCSFGSASILVYIPVVHCVLVQRRSPDSRTLMTGYGSAVEGRGLPGGPDHTDSRAAVPAPELAPPVPQPAQPAPDMPYGC